MTINFLWGVVGSAYNLLTTELNTLGDGSLSALGPEIDNTSNAYQIGRLHLHIASSSLAFTTASFVKVFFFPSNAGSTYNVPATGSTYKLAEPNYLVGVIYINPATQSSAVVEEWIENVRIPAGKFKAAAVYQFQAGGGGSALPSSGNTLDLFPTPSMY